MHRSTKWRHKVGKSKRYYPKGKIEDYTAFAVSICKRFYPPLWQKFREDCQQEAEILNIEAQRKRIWVYVYGKRKAFGDCRTPMGMKQFSRACNARFHEMAKRYWHFKPKNSSDYVPRCLGVWLEKDVWEVPIFESPEFVILQIQKDVPAELFEKAINGDDNATAQMRAIIWGDDPSER